MQWSRQERTFMPTMFISGLIQNHHHSLQLLSGMLYWESVKCSASTVEWHLQAFTFVNSLLQSLLIYVMLPLRPCPHNAWDRLPINGFSKLLFNRLWRDLRNVKFQTCSEALRKKILRWRHSECLTSCLGFSIPQIPLQRWEWDLKSPSTSWLQQIVCKIFMTKKNSKPKIN